MKTRDASDVAEAVERYGHSVQALAFVYLKSHHDAEDAAQDVFLAYLRSTARFDSEAQRRAWLMTVTANRCRSLLRKKRWEPLPEDLHYLPAEESGLLQAMLALDERYRLPLHLHYYEGYSIAEIAALLHRTPAAVGSQLARGREKLRSIWEED